MKHIFTAILLCFGISIQAQQFQYSGQLINGLNEPVIAASIIVENESKETITGMDGKFNLELTQGMDYLLITSYLGKAFSKRISAVQKSNIPQIWQIDDLILIDEILVKAGNMDGNSPFTTKNIGQEDIAKVNQAQDMPYLVRFTPSVTVSSDAGTGVGYTSIRIRGSDPTRINVTINGVPLNDPESHSVYWVNMPDFASSVNNLQIQRGVGSSSFGPGAFGGTMNMITTTPSYHKGLELVNTIGSFGTRKHNIKYNSGEIFKNTSLEARVSNIHTNGYIDRADADLYSYYGSLAHVGNRFTLKAISFGGWEETSQAWYGTPESRINGDAEEMEAHASREGYYNDQLKNLLNSGRTYNYYLYDNEVDNYKQFHQQIHSSYVVNSKLNLGLSLHYTHGKGYFEQQKRDADFEDYVLTPIISGNDTIASDDLIIRRWLDNHFYGLIGSASYESGKWKMNVGISANNYKGDHFGEVLNIGTEELLSPHNYYKSDGNKRDVSSFIKVDYSLNEKLSMFVDMQYRNIEHNGLGNQHKLSEVNFDKTYNFFNPKAGLQYKLSDHSNFYLSYAKGTKEPTRSDFTDHDTETIPQPEHLHDFETGWNLNGSNLSVGLNAFYMYYKDQLVPTGALNDTGDGLRVNAPESYRMGLEGSVSIALADKIILSGAATISDNRIKEFNEIIYDYTNGYEVITNTYEDTHIAFSPRSVISGQWRYNFHKNMSIGWDSKFVGSQYLDNTSNDDRSIESYLVNDIWVNAMTFILNKKISGEILFRINNVLNKKYSANGYTYSYIYGDAVTENFYYPQAGRHMLLTLKLNWREDQSQ